MLSNNNNNLNYSLNINSSNNNININSSNNNININSNNINNISINNSNNNKRDLLTPFLSPDQLLFEEFEECTGELENGDILGDKELQFGIGSNSLLFSSPLVPFSIENDSSNINEIINETYNLNNNNQNSNNNISNNNNINNNSNNYNNDKIEFKLNKDVGLFDNNNIFQLPQPQLQDNSYSVVSNSTKESKGLIVPETITISSNTIQPLATINETSTTPPLLSEPLPIYQPLPIPTPITNNQTSISPDQEAIMTAKQVNKLIEEKQLLNQNQLITDYYKDQQQLIHKDRKPRRPPEYPIHQVNLLMDEIDSVLICKECDYKAKTRKSVQSHIRKAHTDKLDKIRIDCNEIFSAKKEDYSKDSIVCDHYGCGAIIVKYNKSKHYRQPHHIGHPKEISECFRCKEVKQRTMMRNLKKEMKKNKCEQMEIN